MEPRIFRVPVGRALVGLVGALIASALTAPTAVAAPTATNVDWPSYGNDLANTRFQNLDQINPANAAQLQPAWIFHTGVNDKKASLEVSPIEIGGMLYVTDGHDDVFALDAATGTQRWAYKPQSNWSGCRWVIRPGSCGTRRVDLWCWAG